MAITSPGWRTSRLIPSCANSCSAWFSKTQMAPRPSPSYQGASRAFTTNQPSPFGTRPCSVCSSGASGTIGSILERRRRAARVADLVRHVVAAELRLDLVEPVAVGGEAPADERPAEAQVPVALGPARGDALRLLDEAAQLRDLVAQVAQAAEDGRVVEHVPGEQAQLCL